VAWLTETTSKGTGFPAFSGVASPPPTVVEPIVSAPQSLPKAQILASYSTNVSVAIPALSQNAPTTLTFNVALSGFPSPFTVKPNTSATIQASLSLTTPPADSNTTVQPPTLALSLVQGGGSTASSGTWTLAPGTYQAPSLSVTVKVQTTGSGVGAGTAVFICHAQLLGTAAATPPTPTQTPGVTTASTSGPSAVPQVAIVTLVAGTATWTYPVPYVGTPVILATPYTTPVSGTPEIFVGSVTNTSASINSTSNTDVRQVAVLSMGNPS